MKTPVPHVTLLAIAVAALAGCTVNPNTGRAQLIALPAAQIAHSHIGFALATASRGSAAPCAATGTASRTAGDVDWPCTDATNRHKLPQQVERLGAELESQAHLLAPALFNRIGTFRIEVKPDVGAGTVSSASGRIILDAGLAALEPTDDVVAFLIAREMGHVMARHGEEDSGARIAFSAITAVLPIGGLLVRFAASMLGAQALKSTWAEGQRQEADLLALALLDLCDRPVDVIALNLRVGLRHAHLPDGEWGNSFAQSIDRVAAISRARQAVRLAVVN